MKIFPNNNGKFSLKIGDEVYGFYSSAVAAADDVFTFSTGCTEWDELYSTIVPPTDLSEWEYLKLRQ
jgi:hypothetical protein